MESRNLNGLSVVVISLLGIFLVKDSFAQEEMQCAGQAVKMTEHHKAAIADCLDQAGIKTIWKIPAGKLSCFGVCVIEKADMLTPEGKINHEKALKYIEDYMPDSVKKPLIDGVDKCIKEHDNGWTGGDQILVVMRLCNMQHSYKAKLFRRIQLRSYLGDKVRMDNDPNCLTFLDVGQCVHDLFVDICL